MDLPQNIFFDFLFHFLPIENSSVVSVYGDYRRKLLSSLSPLVSVTDNRKLVGKAVGVCCRQDMLVSNKINNVNKKVIDKSVENRAY